MNFLSDRRLSIVGKIIFFIPIICAVLFMLPRIASAQFGLLDDGLTLKMSKLIQEDPTSFLQESVTGRFRPGYWLYFAAQDAVFGTHPLGYFLVNGILLVATIFILMSLVFYWTHNRGLSILSGCLYLLSGSMVESYYTLSKAEPIQSFMIVSLVAIFPLLYKSKHKKIVAAIFLLIFGFSLLIKETSLLLIFLFGFYCFWGWLTAYISGREIIRLAGIFSCALALILVFLWLRSSNLQPDLASGSYTQNYQLTPAFILVSAIRWSSWLIKDYAWFLPLILFLYFNLDWVIHSEFKNLIIASFVWMIVWIAIYLPWIYTSGYYLLPFSLGASVFGATLIIAVVSRLGKFSPFKRCLAILALMIACLLSLLAGITNLSIAAVQLTADQANESLVDYLHTSMAGQPVVYLDYPANHEYIEEMNLHLQELWHTGTPMVKSLDEIEKNGPPSTPYYVLSNVVKNAPPLSVRLGIYENEANERERAFLAKTDAVSRYLIHKSNAVYYFNLLYLFCDPSHPSIYCSSETELTSIRLFEYTWKIYSVLP